MRVVAAAMLVLLAGCANAPPLEGIEQETVDDVLDDIQDDAGVGFCGCHWYSARLSAVSAENRATGASEEAAPEGYRIDPSGTVTVDVMRCQHGTVAGALIDEPAFAVSRTGVIPPSGSPGRHTMAFGAIVNSEELAIAFEAIGIPVAAIGTVDVQEEGVTGTMRAEATSDGLSFTAVHRAIPTREAQGLQPQEFTIPTHFVDAGEVRSRWSVEFAWTQFFEREGGTASFGGDTSRFIPGEPTSGPADAGFILFDGRRMAVQFHDLDVERTLAECP